jgi:thiamine kinase-like enzyme
MGINTNVVVYRNNDDFIDQLTDLNYELSQLSGLAPAILCFTSSRSAKTLVF